MDAVATRAVLAWTLVGVLLRAALLIDPPFLHSDGPGYLWIAQHDITPERWRSALAGYFPAFFPAAIRVAHATGLDWEASGRAVAFVAGVALIPLSARLGTAMLGPAIGQASAALAALHPRLVRSSITVLPETLAAILVASVTLLLFRGSAWAAALAGVLAGVGGQVRPELVLLVPLAVLVASIAAPPGHRLRCAVATAAGAALVLVPTLLVLRAERGEWMLSGKERYFIARKYGTDATSLLDLLVRHPGAFLATYVTFLRRQIGYMLAAMEWVLAIGFVLGFAARPQDATGARAWRIVGLVLALATAALAINPARRYVVPWLPLCLPWIVRGGQVLLAWAARRDGWPAALARRRAVILGALAVLLVARAVRSEPSPEACYRSLCAWIVPRSTGIPVVMADDSRVAYLCGGRFLLRPHRLRGRFDETLATARRLGATVLVVPSRERKRAGSTRPPDVERCQSTRTLGLYVVDAG